MVKKLQDNILAESSIGEVLEYLTKKKTIALDTETTGDFDNIFARKIVMLQLGDAETQFIVDTRETDPVPIIQ